MVVHRHRLVGVVALAAMLCPCLPGLAQRRVAVATDAELRAALRDAQPGDTIRLAPGVYRGGLSARDLHGTEDQPIELTAADPDQPPILRGGNTGLHLVNPRHVVLSHLVIEQSADNGLNIDDGGSMAATARGVRLHRLTVRDIGPRGNHDGIKLSGVQEFTVSQCTLERWGDGGSGIDLVGCHRGRITQCLLRNRDGGAATGIQVKGGSRDILIESCRFEQAARRAVNLGGSTGEAFFRPPLVPRDNAEARDVRVERCLFIGSDAPIAFVTSSHCRVRGNVFYRPTRWVIRLLQEQPPDRFVRSGDHVFEHNTILWRDGDLHAFVNVGPDTRPESLTFEANRWYCEDAPDRSTPRLPVREIGGVHGQRPPEEVFRALFP